MKRICLISTLNHNVGDDFVREGIVWLLRRALGEISCSTVHKHFPVGVRGSSWSHIESRARNILQRQAWRSLPQQNWRIIVSRALDALPLRPASDLLLGSQLVVQCGTPVYWKNRYSKCSQAEWYAPLIQKRWASMQPPVPLLNLGAGSCLAPGSDGSEVADDPACRQFIETFTSAAAITTVRDSVAVNILRLCGHSVQHLPCPSLFSPQAAGIVPQPGEFVALNYMPAGGHYDFAGCGPQVARQWESTFVQTARQLARQHRCLIICHDAHEADEASRLLPELPRFFRTSWRDYLDVYSRCHFAMVNRVHGAMVVAALGKRALLIGNDTRVLTTTGVPGIRQLWVTEAPDLIPNELAALETPLAQDEMPRFIQSAAADYLALLNTLQDEKPHP